MLLPTVEIGPYLLGPLKIPVIYFSLAELIYVLCAFTLVSTLLLFVKTRQLKKYRKEIRQMRKLMKHNVDATTGLLKMDQPKVMNRLMARQSLEVSEVATWLANREGAPEKRSARR